MLQRQSGWIHLADADIIDCESKLPVACRFAAIHTEKGKLSPAHTGRKRKVIVEIEYGESCDQR